ncbi:MAG: hypothetical protein H3C58_14205 [Fimbriimonadaceae bacterium]|nr:hypothetical protein [Fimbriimonadaceae bacterium]
MPTTCQPLGNHNRVIAKRAAPTRKPSPWPFVVPILVLLASLYLFWVLPFQLGEREPQIEFADEATPSEPPR